MHPLLTRSQKLLAWLGVVHGVLSAATPLLLPWLTGHSMPAFGIMASLALGMGSFVAGVYGLRGRPWAFWLLFATFLVQCVEYFSHNVYFSLVGPFSLKVGWGWAAPPSHVNVNVFALAICIWSANVAKRLRKRDGKKLS